ncbi:unnamed protein product [Callosobruchus maculatus]|uniref:Uncharacterized protein n=1 Tax=Callosobruchus maculatus TaxID=64391 RepID=A0A653CJ39_CALMS|nr:unnamed protein product [Callosobruchus maculatus]
MADDMQKTSENLTCLTKFQQNDVPVISIYIKFRYSRALSAHVCVPSHMSHIVLTLTVIF